jgi:Primase C terminal 1 (PriCT-1)
VTLPALRVMLDALFGTLSGYVEFRVLSGDQQECTSQEFVSLVHENRGVLVTFAQRLPTLRTGQNCYFGIATRRTKVNGKLENCEFLPALFVDIDFQSPALPKAAPEDEARARLNTFPHAPSLVVNTGGGLYCCWFLKIPIGFADYADIAKAYTYLRALARATGGDQQSAEPARLLRLPGSFNYKYDPPRQVEVEMFDSERRFTLADFEHVLVFGEPERADPTDSTCSVIPEGSRNTSLMSLAGTMRRRGMSEEAIRAALHKENVVRCSWDTTGTPADAVRSRGQLSEIIIRQVHAPAAQLAAQAPVFSPASRCRSSGTARHTSPR